MSLQIAVLDYGIGNLRSAEKALEYIGASVQLTSDPNIVRDADGIILPGVGAFGPCLNALDDHGLVELSHERIEAGVPFMGICVGMQLLYDGSDESPDIKGLGVLPGVVQRLQNAPTIPQMQWNTLAPTTTGQPHPLLDGIGPDPWVYFVHSYAAPVDDTTIATCTFGDTFAAAVAHDNVLATQFHPEKSGQLGLKILENFVRIVKTA